MNIKKLSFYSICLMFLLANFTATAQSEAKPMEEAPTEAPKLTKEEKKAQIDKERAIRKKRLNAANKYKNQKNLKQDKRMYTYLEMTEEQIKKYEEARAKNQADKNKAIKNQTGEPEELRKAIQMARDENSKSLKSILTADQYDKYMIFQEEEAEKRTRRKDRHKVHDMNKKKEDKQ